jgi:diaminopimelate decarboxylase
MIGPVTGFTRHSGELFCDGVRLSEIARQVGTPVHVYSAALLDERARVLDRAFGELPHRLHYALKANSTLAVVRRFRAAGLGADANSGGEIEVALRAGFSPEDPTKTTAITTSPTLPRCISSCRITTIRCASATSGSGPSDNTINPEVRIDGIH